MDSFSKLVLVLLSVCAFPSCHGRIFTFKMHHRYSEPVKKWSQSTGKLFPADGWPLMDSVEYGAHLADRDRIFRGRRLSDIDAPLAFSDGNSTFRISSLGLSLSFHRLRRFDSLIWAFSLFIFLFLVGQLALHDSAIGDAGNEVSSCARYWE